MRWLLVAMLLYALSSLPLCHISPALRIATQLDEAQQMSSCHHRGMNIKQTAYTRKSAIGLESRNKLEPLADSSVEDALTILSTFGESELTERNSQACQSHSAT